MRTFEFVQVMFFRLFLLKLLFYFTPIVAQGECEETWGNRIVSTNKAHLIDSISKLTLLNLNKASDNVFLVGEVHRLNSGEFDFELIKYLYQYQNVRLILFEWPISDEGSLNYYFETGDYQILKLLSKNTTSKTSTMMEFIRNLYEFNLKLPETSKLIFKTFDVETSYESGIGELRLIALHLEPQPQIVRQWFQETELVLKNVGRLQKKEIEKYISDYSIVFHADSVAFKEALNGKYSYYERVLNALFNEVNSNIQGGYLKNDSLREDQMYKNILEIHAEYPNINIYGRLGRFHTCLSSNTHWMHSPSWTSVAALLNSSSNSPFKGKTCVFLHYYNYNILSMPFEGTSIRYIPQFEGAMKECVLKKAKGDYSIVKVDGENSPFSQPLQFQYLIINNKP